MSTSHRSSESEAQVRGTELGVFVKAIASAAHFGKRVHAAAPRNSVHPVQGLARTRHTDWISSQSVGVERLVVHIVAPLPHVAVQVEKSVRVRFASRHRMYFGARVLAVPRVACERTFI